MQRSGFVLKGLVALSIWMAAAAGGYSLLAQTKTGSPPTPPNNPGQKKGNTTGTTTSQPKPYRTYGAPTQPPAVTPGGGVRVTSPPHYQGYLGSGTFYPPALMQTPSNFYNPYMFSNTMWNPSFNNPFAYQYQSPFSPFATQNPYLLQNNFNPFMMQNPFMQNAFNPFANPFGNPFMQFPANSPFNNNAIPPWMNNFMGGNAPVVGAGFGGGALGGFGQFGVGGFNPALGFRP